MWKCGNRKHCDGSQRRRHTLYYYLEKKNRNLFLKVLEAFNFCKSSIQGLKCQNYIVDYICFIDLENTMWIVVVCIVWPVWASFTRQWRHRVEQGLPQNQLFRDFLGLSNRNIDEKAYRINPNHPHKLKPRRGGRGHLRPPLLCFCSERRSLVSLLPKSDLVKAQWIIAGLQGNFPWDLKND